MLCDLCWGVWAYGTFGGQWGCRAGLSARWAEGPALSSTFSCWMPLQLVAQLAFQCEGKVRLRQCLGRLCRSSGAGWGGSLALLSVVALASSGRFLQSLLEAQPAWANFAPCSKSCLYQLCLCDSQPEGPVILPGSLDAGCVQGKPKQLTEK